MSTIKNTRLIIFSLILLGLGTLSFYFLNKKTALYANAKNKTLIIGEWNVDGCKFKIPGWHTDITNSKYIFCADQKLLIQYIDETDKSINKYFIKDDKTITLRSENYLNEITYKFRLSSEGKLELEDDMVIISLSLIK